MFSFSQHKSLRSLFYASIFGFFLAMSIRDKVDGVAFFFVSIAVVLAFLAGYFNVAEYDRGVQNLMDNIDTCQNNMCGKPATARIAFDSTSVRVCKDCIAPVSAWVNTKVGRENKDDLD